MKVDNCLKCKTKVNRRVVIQKTVKRSGREYQQEEVVYKTFSCECGKAEYSGDLSEELIDQNHKFIIVKTKGSESDDQKEET